MSKLLPKARVPVKDPKTGEIRCDKGKEVTINSVGGAFANERGVVIEGPYEFIFCAKRKRFPDSKDPGKKKVLVHDQFITFPYWMIEIKKYPYHLQFSEAEITFI